MTVLLGFTGALGSGKDEACRQLDEWQSARGLNLVRRGFADQLKVSAARALGFPEDKSVEDCVLFCNDLKKPGREVSVSSDVFGQMWAITGRQFLQYYGTEAHRKVFGTDFWVDALLPWGTDWIKNFGDGCDIAAIPDVRFDNEAKRVKDLGGFIIKMERSQNLTSEGSHASESGVEEQYINYVINNDGTLWDLQQSVISAFENCVWSCDRVNQ
jgi:hypothetical protein